MARKSDYQYLVASAVAGLMQSVGQLVDAVGVAVMGPLAAAGVEVKNAAKPKPGKPSPGRLRQIAAMKAYWRKRKAAEAKK
jgi:hypothetical protein